MSTGSDTLDACGPRRTVRIAFAALLTGAVGIAFAPIFVKLSELPPTATGFWRLALAMPLLVLWMSRETGMNRETGGGNRHRRPASWSDHGRLALAGLFFAGDLAVWHWSLHFTNVTNSTLLANLAPVFVTFGGWALFGRRPTRLFLIGLALALTGAMVLMGNSVQVSPDTLLGDALAVCTALFYGGYILSVGRLRAEFSTATIMAWSGAVTTVTLLVIALLSGEPLIAATPQGWAVLIGLALISHVGGQSLIAYALAHLPAAFSSVSLLVQPATAAILAWPILGEPLHPLQIAGAVIVMAGILLARRGS